jgi:uncharacterized protein YbaR (Trm112 family)
MGFCPECGREYPPEVVACPVCRVVLTAEPPARPGSGTPVVVHRVPDAAAGALLCGVLEQEGIRTVLRTATLPGYGSVMRDWTTSEWGEILVAETDASEARAILADYLAALERGGVVRDEDVESGS